MAFQDPPNNPVLDANGNLNRSWLFWFQEFARRAAKVVTGGLSGSEVVFTDAAGNITSSGSISAASEDSAGVVELSTDAEATTGTNTEKATTPANLTARLASPGAIGENVPATTLRIATHTPSAANDTGAAGTIAWDGSYIYICTATDTWKRAAISTW